MSRAKITSQERALIRDVILNGPNRGKTFGEVCEMSTIYRDELGETEEMDDLDEEIARQEPGNEEEILSAERLYKEITGREF